MPDDRIVAQHIGDGLLIAAEVTHVGTADANHIGVPGAARGRPRGGEPGFAPPFAGYVASGWQDREPRLKAGLATR